MAASPVTCSPALWAVARGPPGRPSTHPLVKIGFCGGGQPGGAGSASHFRLLINPTSHENSKVNASFGRFLRCSQAVYLRQHGVYVSAPTIRSLSLHLECCATDSPRLRGSSTVSRLTSQSHG